MQSTQEGDILFGQMDEKEVQVSQNSNYVFSGNNSRNTKGKKKGKKYIVIMIIIAVILIGIISFVFIYKNGLGPVDNKNIQTKRFVVNEKDTGNAVIKKLAEQKLIKSEFSFKVKYKLSGSPFFKKGRYKISSDKTAEEIITMLKNGDIAKDEIKLQLLEGKTFVDLAEVIAKNTNNSKETVIAKGADKEYLKILMDKYWFIQKDIFDKQIYYPLEGYLFPDTYIFEDKNVSVEKIFETMLNETEKKLSNFKEQMNLKQSNLNIHQLLTLASIVELEANKDARDVVGTIFMNRIRKKISLGSDVTTYYSVGVKMSERDLKISELNAKNPYNTRGPGMEGKLPIGPICMPSKSSIDVCINLAYNYIPTEDLFFVSDKNSKIYTTKTYEEHLKLIKELKAKKLWFEY